MLSICDHVGPFLLRCLVSFIDFKAFFQTVVNKVEFLDNESVRILDLVGWVHGVREEKNYFGFVEHEYLDLVWYYVLVNDTLQLEYFDIIKELWEFNL